ncbi:MAG: folylpolyglutamate synthase/dihydrofolate synthase family protein [Chloroflexota bacterium]
MDYRQAQDYVLGFTDYEKTPGVIYTAANYDLRRMEELLQLLGSPHSKPRTVHIAGTKGKGSTAAMIASSLTTSGHRCGLYTSPHLHTIRERIRVDGTMISEEEFASLVTETKPAVEAVNQRGRFGELTTFEVMTAVGFAHFAGKEAEFQVIEVGLGGRLDATNVVIPEVSVLTSISLDHTQVLGNTVAEIAREKAGIIKQGRPVVSAPQVPEAAEVIAGVCQAKGAPLIKVGRDVTWQRLAKKPDYQTVLVKGRNGSYELTTTLLGEHQLENVALAVAALEAMGFPSARMSAEDMAHGFSQVSWPGRLEVLGRRPLVVADGAHNVYSMRLLVRALRAYFHFRNCIVVFGASGDKDIGGMAREMAVLDCPIIATQSSHPRAAPLNAVVRAFAGASVGVETRHNLPAAMSRARELAAEDDLICVTGSLFVVAEAREHAGRAS